jgi:hypothetical protein
MARAARLAGLRRHIAKNALQAKLNAVATWCPRIDSSRLEFALHNNVEPSGRQNDTRRRPTHWPRAQEQGSRLGCRDFKVRQCALEIRHPNSQHGLVRRPRQSQLRIAAGNLTSRTEPLDELTKLGLIRLVKLLPTGQQGTADSEAKRLTGATSSSSSSPSSSSRKDWIPESRTAFDERTISIAHAGLATSPTRDAFDMTADNDDDSPREASTAT